MRKQARHKTRLIPNRNGGISRVFFFGFLEGKRMVSGQPGKLMPERVAGSSPVPSAGLVE